MAPLPVEKTKPIDGKAAIAKVKAGGKVGSMGRPTSAARRATIRRIKTVMEIIGERHPGWDPIHTLADIANNPDAELSVRCKAATEVAKYIRPQLKAIEHRGLEGLVELTLDLRPPEKVVNPEGKP